MKVLNNLKDKIEVLEPISIDCHNQNELYIENLLSDMHIKLFNNSKLLINSFNIYNRDINITINVILEENSILEFNLSYIAHVKVNILFNYYMIGDNNKCNVVMKTISEDDGKSKITITGTVDKNTINNEMNENIRIIAKNNETNIVEPNMIINTDNVIANHSVAIGKIDDESLNYLMSKGLTKQSAERLIENGFLINCLEITNEELLRITEILLNRK